MEQILDLLGSYVADAFETAGYEKDLGKVTISNRPDLCEYQCNGAMAGAKRYHKAPIVIAQDAAEVLDGCDAFESVQAAPPGFLNLKLSGTLLAGYLNEMREDERLGVPVAERKKKIIIDYGGGRRLSVKASRESSVFSDMRRSEISAWVTGDFRWG